MRAHRDGRTRHGSRCFVLKNWPQKDFLNFCATRLNAVEVNYSFRRMLSEKTTASSLDIPNARRIRFRRQGTRGDDPFLPAEERRGALERFLNSIQPLAAAGRLGPVLFQLPPNLKADPLLLESFLKLLPRKLRPEFEFRDTSCFTDEALAVLKRHQAALCITESDELQTPELLSADFCVLPASPVGDPETERRRISAEMRRRMNQAGDIFAFFKHEEQPESPLYARELRQAVNRGSEAVA
jgi:uncharacterized protein YecE (DUF72 family)